MIKKKDAFGQALLAYYRNKIDFLVSTRDDGYISDAGGVKVYFDRYEKWPIREKQALKQVNKTDRVLDIGCGAGRHSLYLQKRGCDVTGIDNSPAAIKVCKLRGLKKAKILSIDSISKQTGTFDVLLLLCNNFGLLGTDIKAKKLLKLFHRLTPPGARIITESYDSNTDAFREYRKFNKILKRHPGSFRVKLAYGTSETDWFDYIRVSPKELREVLKGTGWVIDKIFPSKFYSYVAVLKKESPLEPSIDFRKLRASDFPCFHRWLNDREFLSFMTYEKEPGAAVNLPFKKTISKRVFDSYRNAYDFAVTVPGEGFIGMVGLKNKTGKEGELYIYIGNKKYWGKGFGAAITKKFLEYCFNTAGLTLVKCSVFGYNKRAIRMYKRLGFKATKVSHKAIWYKNRRWPMIHLKVRTLTV